jgi:hypothetical protein
MVHPHPSQGRRATPFFEFAKEWVTPAPLSAVAATVLDLERYPLWWPQVLAVASLGPDTARVLCRSRLPYTLDLVLDAVSRTPPVLEVALSGDLEGWVRWELAEAGGGTRTTFRQQVTAGGALGVAARALRPVLEWNHRQMMRGARAGLARHLEIGRAHV